MVPESSCCIWLWVRGQRETAVRCPDTGRTSICLNLALASATNLTLSGQYLKSDQNTATTAMLSGTGKERGKLATLMLTHAFTKQIDGYFQAEYFWPGDFYTPKAENAAFLRWQLQFRF